MEDGVFGVERENPALVRQFERGVHGRQVVGRQELSDRGGTEQQVDLGRQYACIVERARRRRDHDVDHIARPGENPPLRQPGEDVLVGRVVRVEPGKHRIIVGADELGDAIADPQDRRVIGRRHGFNQPGAPSPSLLCRTCSAVSKAPSTQVCVVE